MSSERTDGRGLLAQRRAHNETEEHDQANARLVAAVLADHARRVRPGLDLLWSYYRNPMEVVPLGRADEERGSPRPWTRLAQEAGLPKRLRRGSRSALRDDRGAAREVVIENDIAWRVHTMVDFLFPGEVQMLSRAGDESRRRDIETVLRAVWDASGGLSMLQDAALMGHVFGHVDFLVRVDEDALEEIAVVAGRAAGRGSRAERVAGMIGEAVRIEPVEPRRGVALVDPRDYRTLAGYVVRFDRATNRAAYDEHGSPDGLETESVAEVYLGPTASGREDGRGVRAVYENGELVGESPIAAGLPAVPIAHVQNLSQPLEYTGLSEVEPLIPLQDELNARLSDRAFRVTMQAFRMYLAKGLDGFDEVPVGPGQVWVTDNPDASVTAIGGDAHSPSEERHIDEVREAMDKLSAVPPLAGGVVRARIGNLSSANALRLTLLGLTSKTARKRVTYGRGIERVCGMVLSALDAAGVFATEPNERRVRLEWPEAVPEEERERSLTAQTKRRLGVSAERVLSELGYVPGESGLLEQSDGEGAPRSVAGAGAVGDGDAGEEAR